MESGHNRRQELHNRTHQARSPGQHRPSRRSAHRLKLALGRLEDGVELGREHDVALDLELAAHEGLLSVELAVGQVLESLVRERDGYVRLGLGRALVDLALLLEVDRPRLFVAFGGLDLRRGGVGVRWVEWGMERRALGRGRGPAGEASGVERTFISKIPLTFFFWSASSFSDIFLRPSLIRSNSCSPPSEPVSTSLVRASRVGDGGVSPPGRSEREGGGSPWKTGCWGRRVTWSIGWWRQVVVRAV